MSVGRRWLSLSWAETELYSHIKKLARATHYTRYIVMTPHTTVAH